MDPVVGARPRRCGDEPAAMPAHGESDGCPLPARGSTEATTTATAARG